eukprot:scaffold7069_cov101-Skeletonema_dohrnii-CCMP3373.AAC.1
MRSLLCSLVLSGTTILLISSSSSCHAFSTPTTSTSSWQTASTTLLQMSQSGTREDEIRRKITELKREGKLQKNSSSSSSSSSSSPTNEDIVGIKNKRKSSVADDYAEKLSSRLGSSRKARQMGRVLGMDIQYASSAAAAATANNDSGKKRKAKLGSLDVEDMEEDDDEDLYDEDDYKTVSEALEISDQDAKNAIDMIRRNVNDDYDEDEKEEEMDEDDMIDAVAKLLGEKGEFRRAYKDMMVEMEKEEDEQEESAAGTSSSSTTTSTVSAVPSNTKSTS